MPRAAVLIRHLPRERFGAFCAGLHKAGYWPILGPEIAATVTPDPGDLLVSWNRYGTNELLCDRWEAAGGIVLVTENGYVGTARGVAAHYALGLGGHNDPDGVYVLPGARDETRLRDVFGAALAPWQRNKDGHILVAPNRSFGRRGFVQPDGWGEATAAALRTLTTRPVRLRPHPGKWEPAVALADDLAGCACVVIWSSSVGVAALLAGIPVVSMAPRWIGMRAASGVRLADALDPVRPDRSLAAADIGWGMWTPAEVADGAPFRHFARTIDELVQHRAIARRQAG